jgi:Collagen triple helix repeat (20 copies)
MLSRLREHFGTAGLVVAIVALVAALAGGAIAATGGSNGDKATASAKGKQGPRGKTGKTGPQGPAGPAGPAGAQGPAGAKGDAGAAGSNGSAGAKGATGATGATGPTGEEGEVGPEGSAWTELGTLPSEATETGTWAMTGNDDGSESETNTAAISFPIPLAQADAEGLEVKIWNSFKSQDPAECPGDAINPKADPGFLCIYIGANEPGALFNPEVHSPTEVENEVGTSGAVLIWRFQVSSLERSLGSFAVTAP